MTEPAVTRFAQTIGLLKPAPNAVGGRLLRIYPTEGFREPIVLTAGVTTIGRGQDADERLDDDSVSRVHAMFRVDEAGTTVVDLDSTNGVHVNDQRIVSHRLNDGDRVRMGSQIFKFLAGDAVEAQYHEVVYKMLTTDGLTQAYNKRFLLESLAREIDRARRLGAPLCVAMLDLDKFKSINDSLGHLAGDAVLVEFARRLRETLVDGELVARYGGEEFAIVMADLSLDQARTVCERARAAVAATPVLFDDSAIAVTVSIGLAALQPSDLLSPLEIIGLADVNLYQAKTSGRNRVVG